MVLIRKFNNLSISFSVILQENFELGSKDVDLGSQGKLPDEVYRGIELKFENS